MKKIIFACLICVLFVVGCSSNKEANSDKTIPYANPKASARGASEEKLRTVLERYV